MNRRDFFEQLTAMMAVPAGVAQKPGLGDSPLDFPPWLAAWRSLPRQPVWESDDLQVKTLIHAAERSHPVSLSYHSGSRPGGSRQFTPALVFRTADGVRAPIYVSGWCHERRAHRTLRVDQLSLDASPQLYQSSQTPHPSRSCGFVPSPA